MIDKILKEFSEEFPKMWDAHEEWDTHDKIKAFLKKALKEQEKRHKQEIDRQNEEGD